MEIPKFLSKVLADDDEPISGEKDAPKATAPGEMPGVDGAPAKKKKKKRKSGILRRISALPSGYKILIGVVIVVLVVSLLTLPGRNKDPQEAPHQYASISDAVAIENIEFSVAGTASGNTLVGDTKGKMAPAAGNTYYTITVNAKNVGVTETALDTSSALSKAKRFTFTLIYGSGYRYSPVEMSNNGALLENYGSGIIPLQTITGNVCFEVPIEVTTSNAPLALRIQSDQYACTWIIREAPVETTPAKK